MGKIIGLVTYSISPKLTKSDALLVKPLEEKRFTVKVVPWDGQNIDWGQFDSLILRSCWNYHLSIEKFLTWLSTIEEMGISIWNPPEIIRWNAKKTYLFDLEKKGIQIVPTKFIQKNSSTSLKKIFEELKSDELVVKPTIGASAYGVFNVGKEEMNKKQKNFITLLAHSDCLVQPLMKDIQHGELSIVFIGKQFSHAVRKIPRKGEFRTNYEFQATETLVDIDPTIIEQAKQGIDAVPGNLLYGRVDGLIQNGKFILMELELIEPHLFFDLYLQAKETFANIFLSIVNV